MDNINKVVFKDDEEIFKTIQMWQWSYGQILQIEGLNLPEAVEIHFSLQEYEGEAEPRLGVTKDKITEVDIPKFILWKDSKYDYSAYAFIYPSDETSGETLRKIEFRVKARPKPKQEDEDTAKAIIAAVNKLAELKVNKPNTAEVGQVLIVKAVDENGVPTEFEAADQRGGADIIVDSKLSETSKNPIQNAVVAKRFTELSETISEKPKVSDIPTNTSQLTNDSDFQTGTQVMEKINQAISEKTHWRYEKADLLPEEGEENIIYLIPTDSKENNSYDEYIFVDGKPELIGNTAIDLSGYVLEEDLPKTLPNPHKLIFTGAVTAEYDGSGAVTVTIPTAGGGSATERIEKASTDTAVTLEPNKLYVFPEMAELDVSLAEITDTSKANEFHFIFQSGTAATTFSIPDTVNIPSSFSIEANKIYEVSIMENCLTYQSWAVS